MATSLPRRRSASVVACLLFSVIQFVCVCNAGADTYTYNILDYPAITGGDSVGGTIITDSDTGTLTATDIVGGSITIVNPVYGAITWPTVDECVVAFLYATPTSLSLGSSPTQEGAFLSSNPDQAILGQWFGSYRAWNTGSDFQLMLDGYQLGGPLEWDGGFFLPTTGPGELFVIATATATPEPATLTLLGSALLGFGVVYVRRRRAKA